MTSLLHLSKPAPPATFHISGSSKLHLLVIYIEILAFTLDYSFLYLMPNQSALLENGSCENVHEHGWPKPLYLLTQTAISFWLIFPFLPWTKRCYTACSVVFLCPHLLTWYLVRSSPGAGIQLFLDYLIMFPLQRHCLWYFLWLGALSFCPFFSNFKNCAHTPHGLSSLSPPSWESSVPFNVGLVFHLSPPLHGRLLGSRDIRVCPCFYIVNTL